MSRRKGYRLKKVAASFLLIAGLAATLLRSKPEAKAKHCGQAWKLVLSRPGDLGVKFDDNVPDRYAVAMAQALRYWEQTLYVKFHDDSNTETCSVELSVEKAEDSNILAETYRPVTVEFNGVIAVNLEGDIAKIPSDKLVYIFLHEIGHAFGLRHNDDPNSVMYPSTDGGIVLMPSDLKAVSVYHELKRAIFQVKENQ